MSIYNNIQYNCIFTVIFGLFMSIFLFCQVCCSSGDMYLVVPKVSITFTHIYTNKQTVSNCEHCFAVDDIMIVPEWLWTRTFFLTSPETSGLRWLCVKSTQTLTTLLWILLSYVDMSKTQTDLRSQ